MVSTKMVALRPASLSCVASTRAAGDDSLVVPHTASAIPIGPLLFQCCTGWGVGCTMGTRGLLALDVAAEPGRFGLALCAAPVARPSANGLAQERPESQKLPQLCVRQDGDRCQWSGIQTY